MLWQLPEIKVPAEILFNLGPIPVTNTLLCAWLAILFLLVLSFAATRKMGVIPRPVQNFFEWVIEMLLGLCEGVAGKEKGRKFFPLVATIFLYVIINNWIELLPGIESIGTLKPGAHPVGGIFLFGSSSNQIVPWFRPASSDLNLTLSIAIVSVFITQAYGFAMLGPKLQLGKYFSLKRGFINFLIGLLELVLEASRIISFSFRLFGNIFAGDVLLLVIAFLLPFVGPIPMYILELFFGFIQALIFSMLTLVFLTIGTISHDQGHEAAELGTHAEEIQG